jgi:hypothetical protein
MNETELAWAAGFFDGEGSTTIHKRCKERNRTPRPVISIVHNTREQLDRFCAAIDDGKVYGPYDRKKPNHSPYYHLLVTGYYRVKPALDKLWPYLSIHKKQQAEKVFITLEQIRKEKGIEDTAC